MASAEAAHFIITDVPCPAKYGMGGMQRYFSVGSLAAIGIELLIGKDNGLHEAFLAARKDRQTLQEVKNRINALDAGLYEELSMLPRSRQGYVDGLSLIVERLYEGDLSAITRAPAEAGTREFFAQRLH